MNTPRLEMAKALLLLVIVLLSRGPLAGETDPPPPSRSALERQQAQDAGNTELQSEAESGYANWKAEKDPAKRKLILQESNFLSFAIRIGLSDIVADVARGGPNRQKLISVPNHVSEIKLAEKCVLTPLKPEMGRGDFVFRRISENFFEAWCASDGWLFNRSGKLIHHVTVPRRDGGGRQWYGAFLPNGLWITTDLWDQDREINCFSSRGKWLWKLSGAEFSPPFYPGSTERTKALIGWARSDSEGKGWLASAGENYQYKTVWIDPDGGWKMVNQDNQWKMVYPRAMGMRTIDQGWVVPSDDNSRFLKKESTSHGAFAANPSYGLENKWRVTIPGGDHRDFGFWPGSYRTHINSYDEKHLLWFFGGKGNYEGEIEADSFSDAANGRDLLLKDGNDQIIEITPGLKISAVRSYVWSNGEKAKPLAFFDNFTLGFFLREDHGEQEVVLAGWKTE